MLPGQMRKGAVRGAVAGGGRLACERWECFKRVVTPTARGGGEVVTPRREALMAGAGMGGGDESRMTGSGTGG